MRSCIADTGSGGRIPDQRRTYKSLRSACPGPTGAPVAPVKVPGIRDDGERVLDVFRNAGRAMVAMANASGRFDMLDAPIKHVSQVGWIFRMG